MSNGDTSNNTSNGSPHHHHHHDAPIMKTADDAILAKVATVEAGYYQDPYVTAMSRHASGITTTPTATNRRRQIQPIIKRGTHARVCCMDRAITSFLEFHHNNTNSKAQVLVLGCGKDTSYFRHVLHNKTEQSESTTTTIGWYEVDHPSVIQAKAAIVREAPHVFGATVKKSVHGFSISPTGKKSKTATTNGSSSSRESKKQKQTLAPIIDEGDEEEDEEEGDVVMPMETEQFDAFEESTLESTTTDKSDTSTCHWIQHDLRESPPALVEKLTHTSHFDPSLPTLVLLECVLMYLPDDESRQLLQCLTQLLPHICVCAYEPILGSDNFGTVMEQHLTRAGVTSHDSGLHVVRTLDAQLDKLLACGFTRAAGCDMAAAYDSVLTPVQRRDATKAEFLDELEEWQLIMHHYCLIVAAAANNDEESGDDQNFGALLCSIGESSAMGFDPTKTVQKSK
ncbi:Probable leucine carboxyl methyltransferase 1 [Seminavis robusta]|uniref:[phosphatase 2A protein]-leucine-carboxy methyltransferase n=1 Tax=Seminavis robusta TaxID=568900 RepID=A0A9N8HE87_9STRA|nr:Probable leucine carboxyl methyltransferase 1 [Seminavis robusta]|eukprot:Sro393_g133510.1 Probable leucine carboxyl methyltransferase 1 (454) ;mRNA; r:8473-9834